MKQLLRTIVGSQAHGLASKDSDYDYRGVYIVPTSELLKIGGENVKNTSWIEGNEDDTNYELGKFLFLATKCNPTILEVFLAPMVKQSPDRPVISSSTNDGEFVELDMYATELRSLFPHVWNSKYVRDAFVGYGLNQRKKYFDNKDNRGHKYAVAYLRTLYQGWELLTTGTFTVKIANVPEVGERLKKWKNWNAEEARENASEVIGECLKWEKKVNEAYEKNPNKETDIEPINKFLLKIRKEYWE